ncbi:MAG TPA: ACP S-malonyltransferase [Candidatus Tyrphobacter sp.]
MTRVAAIFPGQGSQSVGMGVDVAACVPAAREIFERAQRVLGYDLLALVREGPEERLRETEFSQPAIFTTNVALFAACEPDLHVVVSAGHSFAEFCSLTVARALSFEDALRVVDERAKAMQEAARAAAGGMAAILGLEAEHVRPVIERLRRERGTCLQLANFNSPTQIVISGDLASVQAAGDALLEAGAKRVVPLNVSGAWHSELMRPAVERFAAAVDAAHFSLPIVDVVSNVDGIAYRDVESIKRNLVRSITDEVRWHETAERVLSYDPELVVEFGASPVLTSLMRRLPGVPRILGVSDMQGVASLRAALDERLESPA